MTFLKTAIVLGLVGLSIVQIASAGDETLSVLRRNVYQSSGTAVCAI